MTSNQLIKKIQTKCPKFSAVTLSMIRHSEDYGIIFSPKALSAINLSYTSKDLNEVVSDCVESNKKSQQRKKQTQKLTKEQNKKLKEKLLNTNKTKQEYILELIRKDLND